MNQLIVSISRQYGSGGHEIGEKLAEALGIKFYDRTMLDEIAAENDIEISLLEKYDEKPKKRIISRRVNGHSNSLEEIVADLQFDYIRRKAESGESFVVIGRCSDIILKGYPGLVTVFITGDMDEKIKRIMRKYQLEMDDAINEMRIHDKHRKQYHNRHSDMQWGDSRNYNLCINSSPLGVTATAEIIKAYIDRLKTADPND